MGIIVEKEIKDMAIVVNSKPTEFMVEVKKDVDHFQNLGYTVEVHYSFSAHDFSALIIARE